MQALMKWLFVAGCLSSFFVPTPLWGDVNKDEMKAYTQQVRGTQVKFDMVPIPAGRFLMGSPATEADRGKDEGPPIDVEVDAFWMGKHEVTWDELMEFVNLYNPEIAKRREIPKDKLADAVSIPSPFYGQEFIPVLRDMGFKGGYPASNMTQYTAKQYTKWLSKKTGRFYRLPTEAEWEYAARAGSKTAFSFGDQVGNLADHAWYADNSSYKDGKKGHPEFGAGYRKVGQKKPNAWGLYDMHGNVAEWCIDGYVADHYAKFAGKRVKALDIVAWPTALHPRVIRGGHWDSFSENCRSAARARSHARLSAMDPDLPHSPWWHTDAWHIGFRLVRPLKEPAEKEKQKYWDADSDDVMKAFEDRTKGGQRNLYILVDEADEADDAKKAD